MDSGGTGEEAARSPLRFFALTVLLGSAFYLLGPLVGSLSRVTRAELPGAALGFVCPAIAAAVLVARRTGRQGLRRWLRAALRRPTGGPAWYAAAVLILPAVMAVSYLVLRLTGRDLPPTTVPWLSLPVLLVVFLVSGLVEELGWSAYAVSPLERRYGALAAALLIGAVWAGWHAIPYAQGGHGPAWVAGQCAFSVAFRVVLVWLYVNTGRTLVAPVLCHAAYNLAWVLFPDAGSHYDPVVMALLTTVVAIVITVAWTPRTLAGRATGGHSPSGRPDARPPGQPSGAGRPSG